jgi:hypothetical protein
MKYKISEFIKICLRVLELFHAFRIRRHPAGIRTRLEFTRCAPSNEKEVINIVRNYKVLYIYML